MKINLLLMSVLCLFLITLSCSNENVEIEPIDNVPVEHRNIIEAMGYDSDQIEFFDDDYVVEGDILITLEHLDDYINNPQTRQTYYNNNLIKFPDNQKRTIRWVCMANVDARFADYISVHVMPALNSINDFALEFEQVSSSSSADLVFYNIAESGGQYIHYPGLASLPRNGNCGVVHLNTIGSNDSKVNIRNTAHLVLHALGMGHTSDKNNHDDVSGGNKAEWLQIPGTRENESSSVMSPHYSLQWQGFSSNDIKALKTIYPYATKPPVQIIEIPKSGVYSDEYFTGPGVAAVNEKVTYITKKNDCEYNIPFVLEASNGSTRTGYYSSMGNNEITVKKMEKLSVDIKYGLTWKVK